MPVAPIILNQTHLVPGTLNQFRIAFPTTINLNDYSCSIGNSFVYNSWYNISAKLNNNTFQLRVPTSSGSTLFTLVLPDGSYNISTLNSYLQYWLISQGLYITNTTTGLNTYYASFQLSSQSYAVQFITTALPTSLPAGYSNPGSMTFPVSANQSYQLTILSTNGFKDIIGFSAGTYPSSATISGSTYTYQSDYIPNVNPINTIEMRLSCLYNQFSSNSTLLHVFNNNGTSIGQQVNISPLQYNFIKCQGSHREITLSFYTQLGPLDLLDPNICVKLLFKKKSSDESDD